MERGGTRWKKGREKGKRMEKAGAMEEKGREIDKKERAVQTCSIVDVWVLI